MTPKGILTLVLFAVVASLAIGVLAITSGSPGVEKPEEEGPGAAAVEVAEGLALFRDPGPEFGCATCHGDQVQGTSKGPSLIGVTDLYLKKFNGNPALARNRFLSHLREPEGFPAIRNHGKTFLEPMPSYKKLTGQKLASLLSYLMSLHDH